MKRKRSEKPSSSAFPRDECSPTAAMKEPPPAPAAAPRGARAPENKLVRRHQCRQPERPGHCTRTRQQEGEFLEHYGLAQINSTRKKRLAQAREARGGQPSLEDILQEVTGRRFQPGGGGKGKGTAYKEMEVFTVIGDRLQRRIFLFLIVCLHHVIISPGKQNSQWHSYPL